MTDEQDRYPVGRPPRRSPADAAERVALIEAIERTPARIRTLVSELSDRDLETRYREGGWTIRQVVHHVPDSHINAYIRMKLAVTEDRPAIRTYEEALWAELPDGRTAPVQMSLDLVDALHRRWVACLRGLTETQLRRAFLHPQWGEVTVDEAIVMYEWHCRHHTAHIEHALARRAKS